MKVKRRAEPKPGFMLAPMIDMTFLLLIFFMVTTKITKDKVKLEVALPTAANAVRPDDLSNRDIINIDGEGRPPAMQRPHRAPQSLSFGSS